MASQAFDDSNWAGYDEYTSDNTKVDNANDNLMIDLRVHASADFWSNVKSDGGDIRVTNSAGDTAYSFELENFDSTAETGIVFFNSQGLQTGSDTTYRVYSGNASASLPAASDTLGAQNVWNNNYVGVWHLSESSGSANDSTSNSNDGTYQGDLPTQVSGQLGNAQDLDGTGDYISANDATLDNGNITASAWIRPDANHKGRFLNQWDSDTDSNRKFLMDFDQPNNRWVGIVDDGTNTESVVPSGVSANTTYHTALTWDGTTLSFYVDNSKTTSSGSASGNLQSVTELNIGVDLNGSNNPFQGWIDEVRLLDTALSDNWISTEYNNQSDNTNFWSVTSNFATRRIFNIS